MTLDRSPIPDVAIVVSAVIGSAPIYVSIETSCYLVYDPEILVFLSDDVECAHAMDRLMFITVSVLSAIPNSLNFVIFVKLLKDKMNGMSEVQKSKRRKRFQLMFTQSVMQDALQVIDMANFNFVSKLVDQEWWLFTFCCLSFAMVYVLDGLSVHALKFLVKKSLEETIGSYCRSGWCFDIGFILEKDFR